MRMKQKAEVMQKHHIKLFISKQAIPHNYLQFERDICNRINSLLGSEHCISEKNITVNPGDMNKQEIEIQCSGLEDVHIQTIQSVASNGHLSVSQCTIDTDLFILYAKQIGISTTIEDVESDFNNNFPVEFSKPPETTITPWEIPNTFRLLFKLEDSEDVIQLQDYFTQNSVATTEEFEYCKRLEEKLYMPVEKQSLFSKYQLYLYAPHNVDIRLAPLVCDQLCASYAEFPTNIENSVKMVQKTLNTVWTENEERIQCILGVTSATKLVTNTTIGVPLAMTTITQRIMERIDIEKNMVIRKQGIIACTQGITAFCTSVTNFHKMRTHIRSMVDYLLQIKEQIIGMKERELLFQQLTTELLPNMDHKRKQIKKIQNSIDIEEEKQKKLEEEVKEKMDQLGHHIFVTEDYLKQRLEKQEYDENKQRQQLKVLQKEKDDLIMTKKRNRSERRGIINQNLEEIKEEKKKLETRQKKQQESATKSVKPKSQKDVKDKKKKL